MSDKTQFKKKQEQSKKHYLKLPDFSHHIDRAAIIDRIDLSVQGHLNEIFREQELANLRSPSILHPGGFYAACIFGKWRLTGNPISILHGRVTPFKNVPPLRFTMHSEHVPVTGAQLELCIRRWVREPNPRINVSSVELAFDFTGFTVEEVERQFIHRATKVTHYGDYPNYTVYVGAPTSSWEARLYGKLDAFVRLEFILRRPFLSRCGMDRLEDLVLLRKLNIWELLSLRRFSYRSAERLTREWGQESIAREQILDWFAWKRPKEGLLHLLRVNRIKPTEVFRRTSLQRRLREMQRFLLW